MYCLCLRFNSLAYTGEDKIPLTKLTKQSLDQKIASGDIFVTQTAFCLLFSTNSFFKL